MFFALTSLCNKQHGLAKNILISLIVFSFVSCNTSKKLVDDNAEVNSIKSLLQAYDKTNDPALKAEIQKSYLTFTEHSLSDINGYKELPPADRWDKIINTYELLSQTEEAIQRSRAKSFIAGKSYQSELKEARADAIADYYSLALEKMQSPDKYSHREAYRLLTRINNYHPGYKDVRRRMRFLSKKVVLYVVVNPILDRTNYYKSSGSNQFGNTFNNTLLLNNLISDLEAHNDAELPTFFVTSQMASAAGLPIDLVIDITWVNLNIEPPTSTLSSNTRSKEIEIGKDTLGNPILQTIVGKVSVEEKNYMATSEIVCRITDAITREDVHFENYQSAFNLCQYYATYEGDQRSLTKEDEQMLKNDTPPPSEKELLKGIYEKAYAQLKEGIAGIIFR